MLIYYGWRLYYCAPLVWASTLSLLAAAPLYLYGRQMLDEYQVTDESRALLLLATDYLLSATLLSGMPPQSPTALRPSKGPPVCPEASGAGGPSAHSFWGSRADGLPR